jgi:hypothetical protein
MRKEFVMDFRERFSRVTLGLLAGVLLLSPCAAQVLSPAEGNGIVIQNHFKNALHVELYENAANCSGDTAILDGIEPGSERSVKVAPKPEQAMLVSCGFLGGKKMFSFPMEKSKNYAIRVGEGADGCAVTVADIGGAAETPVPVVERQRTRSPSALCRPKE